MKHALLPLDDVFKQDDDDVLLADAFLGKRAARPEPKWYADLLDEHRAEIAAMVLLWFQEVEATLAKSAWVMWNDALWGALEERLAELFVPVLGAAAFAATQRLAIETDEPVGVKLAADESTVWAASEAARQARLIANETRDAVLLAMHETSNIGLPEQDVRDLVLGTGLFALNRRFAGAALRPYLRDKANAAAVAESAARLTLVRREMIEETATVSSVNQGFVLAGLLWEREGKVATKMVITQEDEWVCPVCYSMHMQETPLRGLFVDYKGNVYDRSPFHILCRCYTMIGVRGPTN